MARRKKEEGHICSWCNNSDPKAVLIRNNVSGLETWCCARCWKDGVPNMSISQKQKYFAASFNFEKVD